MRVAAVSLRDFRSYAEARAELGPRLTVVHGPNGAGKTNLLEALYFGCTGRSCRTANEREVVRFGCAAARVVVDVQGDDGPHELSVGFAPGQPKRMRVDGAAVERLLDVEVRPLLSVFMPDRLELIKGAPALRRAHLDQLVAALWPARAPTRRAYAQALAQRNALIARIRAGRGGRDHLHSWDSQLARHGFALTLDRRAATEAVAEAFSSLARELGLGSDASISYQPRSKASTSEELLAELDGRVDSDLERGFTGHGPHRDELIVARGQRELRVYGSQGQQRLALLALLLAEREALTASRDAAPLILLDDVMSELDGERREALVEVLRVGAGQSVISTTDLDHVPGARESGVAHLAVLDSRVMVELAA